MENEFVAMIGISSFMIPYHVHRLSPVKSNARKKIEISCAFFSFKSLINCGSSDADVNTPAAIPTHSVIQNN